MLLVSWHQEKSHLLFFAANPYFENYHPLYLFSYHQLLYIFINKTEITQNYNFKFPNNRIIYHFYKPVHFVFDCVDDLKNVPFETQSLTFVDSGKLSTFYFLLLLLILFYSILLILQSNLSNLQFFPDINAPSLKLLDLSSASFQNASFTLLPSVTHFKAYREFKSPLSSLPQHLKFLYLQDHFIFLSLQISSLLIIFHHLFFIFQVL